MRGARKQEGATPPAPLTAERVDRALRILAQQHQRHPGLMPIEAVRALASRLLAERDRLQAAPDIDAILMDLAAG